MVSVTLASKRDGRLCTITATITSNSNATTSFDVVGRLVQISITRTTGTEAFTLNIEDTASGMELCNETGLETSDINPSQLNSGAGSYCRGPLKVTSSSTNGEAWVAVIFYVKM